MADVSLEFLGLLYINLELSLAIIAFRMFQLALIVTLAIAYSHLRVKPQLRNCLDRIGMYGGLSC